MIIFNVDVCPHNDCLFHVNKEPKRITNDKFCRRKALIEENKEELFD